MKNKKDVIKQVVDYIEENLEEEINLDKIAKNAGYSKFYRRGRKAGQDRQNHNADCA